LNRRSKIPDSFERPSTETNELKDLESIRPEIPKRLLHPMYRGVNFDHQGRKRYRMNVAYLDERLIPSRKFKHQSMGSVIKNILWRME
jgi:hypothetical protein